MAIITHRSDPFDIADRYFAPSECVATWVDRLKTPVFQWPWWGRRLYVLTWPFSFLTRVMAFVFILVLWIILAIGGFIGARLA